MKLAAIGAIGALGAISAMALSTPAVQDKDADAAHPTVIELYQSQGCSSCPPALAVLRAEADRPDVLALNFAVTYWDHLGWKDRFADPAYTKRQWDYANAAGRGQVATPQLIVNGRGVVNGGNRAEVDAAIRRWDRHESGPELNMAAGVLTVGAGDARGAATVWLVSYDPRTVNVPIRAGENNGKTLPHRNIVTGLVRIGEWSGKPARLPLPAVRQNMRRAVLVQAGVGGPIVAARRID